MKATVDANILFSALLKEGITRRIWFVPEAELYAPEFMLVEFHKYKNFLQKKFRDSEEEFESISKKLLLQIRFVKDDSLKPYLPAVASLINDPKDWLYLACALKEDTAMWSNDKGFKKQARVKVFNTEEMKKEFGTL